MDTMQITPIVMEVVNQEYVFTVQYYLATEADKIAYKPKIGSIALWAGKQEIEGIGGQTLLVDPIVRGFKLQSYLCNDAAPYILHITARIKNEDIYINTLPITDIYNVKAETRQGYLPIEWWGARKASSNDEAASLKNIDGTACKRGDFIYKDATTSSIGTANDFKYSQLGTTNHPDIARAMNNVDLCEAIISFYSSRPEHTFYNFQGTNGTMPGQVSGKLPSTGTGKWLASRQDITTEYRDNKKLTKVVRRIKLAPYGGIWNTTKNPPWDWTT